jgi:hypothetical protein
MTLSPHRRGEIIDALRRSTVPRFGLDALAVGIDRFANQITQLAAGDGLQFCLIVLGEPKDANPDRHYGGMISVGHVWVQKLVATFPRTSEAFPAITAKANKLRQGFNRNDGLIGKGAHKLDLLIGERPHCLALQAEDTDGRSFSQ